MTYKGAIDEVKSLANNSLMPDIFKPSLKKIAETLEMERPIERPKGEWDINCQGIVFCSKCKKVFNHNYDIDYMESHFNFCPNCGADMRGKAE